jgi:hypothetical protein
MNDPRERAAELRPDLDMPWSNKAMLWPILNVAAPILLRPHVIFENGRASEMAWQDQLESDAPTMVIISHPEEIDAVMMAPIAQNTPALRQMRYETLVVAKESLRHLPHAGGLAGYIIRHGGTVSVERPFEYPNETPEEKAARQKRNMHSRDIGTTALEAGGNLVIYIEGGSGKRIQLPDGNYKKIPREPDEQLPAQDGFAKITDGLSPETRDKLRFMTIVSRYRPRVPGLSRLDPRRLTRLRKPTTVILDPAKPVDGTVEEVRQQGEDLMRRGFELAIELDDLR